MLALLFFMALPNADEIKAMPEVASVEVRSVSHPSHRIIHVLNWHYVSREDYALDADPDGYDAFLDDVEAVQLEQVTFLKRLLVRQIHYEGLTDKNKAAFVERAKTLKNLRPRGDSPIDELLRQFRRDDELQLGSPGRLLMNGDIDEVLSGDDHMALEAANPIKDGKVEFDQKLNEAREDAVVRLLLKQKESVIIMGADHDLADNLPADVDYVRVTLRQYRVAESRRMYH